VSSGSAPTVSRVHAPRVLRTRATRSAHPGVVLMKPDSRNPTWRARCEDPDLGKRVKVRLDPLGAGKSAQSRRAWAIAKARQIAKRRDELASGAPRATRTHIGDAIARYFRDHPRLRPLTSATYLKATNKLEAWCAATGLRSADHLTLAHLVAFRSHLASAPKRGAKARSKRGTKVDQDVTRAASSVNVEIRSIKVVLSYLRRVGLLPRLSRDDLTDGLRVLETAHDAPAFLRPPEIRQLLGAADEHDADTYKETRAEHRGRGPAGGTLRYPAIGPVIRTALYTGMRFGELVDLDWSEVDLEAGEIRLTSRTKTKRARTISLEVSSTLPGLLAAQAPPEERQGRVWKLTADQVKAAARRLDRHFGAPEWSWQMLRRTCGTYLTNAPGIFAAASAYRSARQLGHSVTIAERHYLGVVRISPEAKTLESAMGIGEPSA
jgi:integrase